MMVYLTDRSEYNKMVFYNVHMPILDLPGAYIGEQESPDFSVATEPLEEAHVRDRRKLRHWWQTILGEHGRYPCFAILLMLPTDTEMLHYVREFASELDAISGENCLIIALSRSLSVPAQPLDNARRGLISEKEQRSLLRWHLAVEAQAYQGHSIKVADLFGVSFEEFPSLILLRDIRSPEHVLITLRDMTTKEIAREMRTVFSTIQKAVRDREDPLAAIERSRKKRRLFQRSKVIISKVQSFAGQTFEKAMEAWIKSIIG